MGREQYDLFEIHPDGAAVWRDVVSGREQAVLKLRELSAATANEVRVIHLPTNTVVAAFHAALTSLESFQVKGGDNQGRKEAVGLAASKM